MRVIARLAGIAWVIAPLITFAACLNGAAEGGLAMRVALWSAAYTATPLVACIIEKLLTGKTKWCDFVANNIAR